MATSSPSPSSSSSSLTYLLATSSDVVKTWEFKRDPAATHALSPRQEFSVPLTGGPFHCVRWNHNSQVIAAGHDSGAIGLLHESGKVLEVLQEPNNKASSTTTSLSGAPTPVLSLAWGGRSRYLCTSGGADHCPSLWDLKKKERVNAFRGHQYPVTAVAFASDDSHVASGNNHGEILLHNLKSEEPAMVLPLDIGGAKEGSAPLTPSASIAAAVRSVNYWAMRQPLLLSGYRSGDARVWDTTTGTCLTSFKGQHQAAITAVVGSTVNNKLLATAGLDRRLILLDVNQRKLLRECKAVAPINDMTFNAEGDMILVACTNGDVSAYDLRKPNIPCETVRAYQGMPVRSLAVQYNSTRTAATTGVVVKSAPQTAAASTTTNTTTPAATNNMAPPAATSLSEPPSLEVKINDPPIQITSTPSVLGTSPQAKRNLSTHVQEQQQHHQQQQHQHQQQQQRPSSSLSSSSSTSSGRSTPTTVSSLPSSKPTTTTTSAATAPAAAQQSASLHEGGKQQGKREEAAAAEKEVAPHPQGPHQPPASSSFRWHDKGATTSSTSSSTASSTSTIESSNRNAAAAAAAAAAVAFTTSSKEMAQRMESKMKDLVADLRDEIATDLRSLHLELLRTSDTTQMAMQGLAATFQALVDENKALRQEVEGLQQQMEMPF